jgi:oligoribonuclease NrnB/cAMP/cGMP phosphodiesterase (DHH superfamily)
MKFLTDKNNDDVSIILFDHHLSWLEKYEKEYKKIIDERKKTKVFFDQKNIKSACGLSFDFFKQKALNKKDVDKNKVERVFHYNLEIINNYIEDSDTGNFKIKYIHEFKSALAKNYSLQYSDLSCKTYPRIKMFLEINPSYLCKTGEKMLKKIKKQAKNVLKQNNIYIVELKGGYKFLICITEQKYVRNYACPFLAKISKKKGFLPIGGFVYKYVNQLYKFSMRTCDDTCDVAKIAGMYGGGGHKTAAAFTIEYKGIENLILKEINIYNDIDKTPM